MATGSISSLGVGSGLELQSILDQLKSVDEQVITRKENEVTALETQLNEFTVVNNALLAMKSASLDLSLSSTFIARTVSSSDESALTATVADGTAVQTTPVIVERIATKSTFISSGAASESAIVYVPTSQESTTGVAALTSVVDADGGNLVISYGAAPATITVAVPAGTKLEDGADQANSLVHLINSDGENLGKVTASSFLKDGNYYLRIETATAGGTGEANRVKITTNTTDLTLSPPTKTFAINAGTKTMLLNVAADTTMKQLRDQINNSTSNPGVTASIINDGAASNPYKLVLKANSTGKNNEIAMLGQLPDLTMALPVGGATGENLNAKLTIDGVSYQRQTNTVNDVLSGITLTLKAADPAAAVTVTVANNDAAIKEMVVALVDAYNTAVQEISENTGYDETTEDFGILARTTLRDMPYTLQNLMTTTVRADSAGLVTTLFDLGLEFDRDGTIVIDETVLATAISAAPDSVSAFFLGDEDAGITGLADTVNDYLREVTGSGGQVEAEKTAAQTRIDDLELKIESETERLDKRYEILSKQFIELDRYMSQMKSMGNYLTGQFDSLSNMLSQK